jgi:small subunit ribosomal protein S16
LVRIRLKKVGRRHINCFRIGACDGRAPRDGRVLEVLGTYQPDAPDESKQVTLKTERIEHWLAQGAVPSETVASIFRRHGIKVPKGRRRKGGRAKAKAPSAPEPAAEPKADESA